MIHTIKGFGIVNKAEIDVFLELSSFFDDPADIGNLISSSSAFSKTSLNIWNFTVHVLMKPGLENFSAMRNSLLFWKTTAARESSWFWIVIRLVVFFSSRLSVRSLESL